MRPDLCIYHGNCADGFTAAWAIWKRWPDVEFAAGFYGQEPPNVTGKHVLLVDFSYKRPVLEAMAADAASVTVVDHHKTAEADLAAFTSLDGVLVPGAYLASACRLPIQARFRMDKSGAMLAWEYAFPGIAPPRLVQHVQDRDLWRFELEGTRAIQATVFSHPYTFEAWDRLAADCETDDGRSRLIAEGEAIERKHFKDMAELLAITTREMTIGGHRVKVANLPYTFSSDAAGKLAEGAPFGACYFENSKGERVFSLRARDGGVDVSAIASSYGGGGHAKAAGFTAPPLWEGEAGK